MLNLKKNINKLLLVSCIIPLLTTTVVSRADESQHVTVDNWQTHKPRVTALRSLNAYLATDKGQTVYYVPTLNELPDIKNAVSDSVDYKGSHQKFAAVYDGYFNQMCYEALVRKADGTYSNTPAIVQSEGKDKARELTTLGYDLLLTDETITNITTNGEDVDVTYTVHKVDATNGVVDLNTALMDIYKAVGQNKYDITYIYTPDSELSVTSSPIQGELNLNLAADNAIDTSAGKAWVFVTRTNPILYWKQAVYDGIVLDAESFTGSHSESDKTTKSSSVTLAEFCEYAYNIMNIYGEPVITQSEKSILLQLYGTVVPYSACTDSQSRAIETLVAKGIISPEDDQQFMNWNVPIDYGYMLTMLMRIADTNARTTYKDVQITLDSSLIEQGYYQAELTLSQSSIVDFTVAEGIARTTNYYDYELSSEEFERLSKSFDTNNVDLDLFIPTHLAIIGPDGTAFPITTQVTPYTHKVYSKDYPGIKYVQSSYDAGVDGPLVQFAVSEGMVTRDTGKYLKLRVVSFDIPALLHADGMYHLSLINDKGKLSDDSFKIKPGGGTYYESGDRAHDSDDMLTDESESEYSNEDEIQQVLSLYKGNPKAAKQRADELIYKYGDNWTANEIEAIQIAGSTGIHLSADSYVYVMEIVSGSEDKITVQLANGSTRTLKDIMSGTPTDDMYFADPDNVSDLAFKSMNARYYQVYNGKSKGDLKERIRTNDALTTQTAFCKRERELLVSTDYLLEAGFIVREPTVVNDILELSTDYANIYLDRDERKIIVGACVYDVRNISPDEIWRKMDDNYFINFRAVLGWTGDYLVFKTSSGNLSVSIKSSPIGNDKRRAINSVPIHLGDVPKNNKGIAAKNGSTVYVQTGDSNGTSKSSKGIPMTSMYPFANYFVYIHPEAAPGRSEYIQDWLFVFKPKDIQVNGEKIIYDDTASRRKLEEIGLNVKDLSKDITVWAYPLVQNSEEDTSYGMPSEMSYSAEYGYMYTPNSDIKTQADMLVNYFDTEAVLKGKESPVCTLPFYIDKEGAIQCVNYNVYYSEDLDGNTRYIDYGYNPVYVLSKLTKNTHTKLYNMLVGVDGVLFNSGIDLSKLTIFPTVTSPALWFTDRVDKDVSEVSQSVKNGALAYWGTLQITFNEKGNKTIASVGSLEITDKLENQTFVIMRDTARKSGEGNVGTWYSVSSLTKMGFDKNNSDIDSDSIIPSPPVGELDSKVDVIDWNEFTATRLMETGETIIAVLMVLVLNIIPRIALFLFLLLIMLGVIQNVKFWQLFCDRVFDVYKLLTFGHYDVHTFRQSRMFVHSIIAMAIFSLFMDGTIIHVYELIMQFFAIIFGMR